MRARRFRPLFDCLDSRIVLDSGAGAVSGANVGATVLQETGPNAPSSQPDPNDVANSGDPDGSDPNQIPIPWSDLPSN